MIGPFAEARRVYLIMSSMAAKMPEFEAVFPAEHALYTEGSIDPTDDEKNARAVEWLMNHPKVKAND